jgi:transketolase
VTAMRDAWAEALVEVAADDQRIVLLDGDLANSTKADKFAEAYPDRFLQMGIAEQNLIGTAVGLSTVGFTPWLSSFGVFFTHRALDPVRMLAAQTDANVKIAAAYTGLLSGLTGKTHHDVEDLAIMRAMPGMTVLAPADPAECRQLVRWASAYRGPVYLRVARDAVDGELPEPGTFELGQVRRVRSGDDLVLVSTGAQSVRVLRAAEQLAERGVDCAVVHVPSIKPMDEAALLEALGSSTDVVVIEDHNKYGGLGGLVAEVLVRHGRSPRFRHIAVEDEWSESAPNDYVLHKHGLSVAALVDSLHEPAW